MLPATCTDITYTCNTAGSPVSVFYEVLGAALLLYQLVRQYELWEEDIENLQELAECYEEIGTKYKDARLGLRGRDQEVYDYQNSRPSYPGPCYERVEQARLNSLISIRDQHERSLKAIPGWACGDKNKVNYEAAKAEIVTGLHAMGESENYEQNQVDRYEQMRISAIARSSGGAVPNVSGAFRTVSAIAQDSLKQSTIGLNSALGAFGNAVGSINNKYNSNERAGRFVPQQQNISNTTVNDFDENTFYGDPLVDSQQNNSLVDNSSVSATNEPR